MFALHALLAPFLLLLTSTAVLGTSVRVVTPSGDPNIFLIEQPGSYPAEKGRNIKLDAAGKVIDGKFRPSWLVNGLQPDCEVSGTVDPGADVTFYIMPGTEDYLFKCHPQQGVVVTCSKPVALCQETVQPKIGGGAKVW